MNAKIKLLFRWHPIDSSGSASCLYLVSKGPCHQVKFHYWWIIYLSIQVSEGGVKQIVAHLIQWGWLWKEGAVHTEGSLKSSLRFSLFTVGSLSMSSFLILTFGQFPCLYCLIFLQMQLLHCLRIGNICANELFTFKQVSCFPYSSCHSFRTIWQFSYSHILKSFH